MDEPIIFTKALAFLKFISEEKMDEPLKVAQKINYAPQFSSWDGQWTGHLSPSRNN